MSRKLAANVEEIKATPVTKCRSQSEQARESEKNNGAQGTREIPAGRRRGRNSDAEIRGAVRALYEASGSAAYLD